MNYWWMYNPHEDDFLITASAEKTGYSTLNGI